MMSSEGAPRANEIGLDTPWKTRKCAGGTSRGYGALTRRTCEGCRQGEGRGAATMPGTTALRGPATGRTGPTTVASVSTAGTLCAYSTHGWIEHDWARPATKQVRPPGCGRASGPPGPEMIGGPARGANGCWARN